MAETAYQSELEVEQIDDDVLPDGIAPERGLPIFEFLDAGNLVDKLDDSEFTVGETMRLHEEAEDSMLPWQRKYEKALKLAKLEAESEKKTFPFEGASTAMLPFLLEAMLDFHSRTVPELVWAKEVVNIKTYGEDDDQKKERATRVSDYMNYQITEQIPTWRSEQDKLLLQLPCVGTGYKLTYQNNDEQEARSDLYMADQIKFNHGYKTFADAPDKFITEEFTRNEVLGFIRGNAQWDLEEEALPTHKDHPEDFEFLRAYTWVDLDDDGLDEPYEVIIYVETQQCVSVYPAYDEEGITVNENGEIVKVEMAGLFTQYRFLPDPEGGPMGMGWGILLCDMFDALNTSVRQMIDAGTLANLAGNSGLIDAQMSGGSGRGNRQQSGPIEVRMGELTPVTVGGKSLGQSVVQFPYQGPNSTLFELTQWMLEQIRGMTNSATNMDTNSQEAAIMYLARLQQGLKVPNSIVMRVYDSAKEEFTKIAMLNYKHYSDTKYNKVIDGKQEHSMRADFDPEDCDIRPAADPSQGTDIEQQQRASIVLEEAKTDEAGILNKREAYLDWLKALKITDVERLAPEPSGEPDPMEQMMMANLQREAELADRDMKLKEAKLNLDQMESMMKHMREGAEFGIDLDIKEADIALKYAQAMKALWEIGMAGDNPVATIQDIETALIDKRATQAPPQPLPSPDPNRSPESPQ